MLMVWGQTIHVHNGKATAREPLCNILHLVMSLLFHGLLLSTITQTIKQNVGETFFVFYITAMHFYTRTFKLLEILHT